MALLSLGLFSYFMQFSQLADLTSAMNTIVASRAGKDLISSLASGLLTIGSRFGGALDEAASMFSSAHDRGLTPREFVDESRRANKLSLCPDPWWGCFVLMFDSQSAALDTKSRVLIILIYEWNSSRNMS